MAEFSFPTDNPDDIPDVHRPSDDLHDLYDPDEYTEAIFGPFGQITASSDSYLYGPFDERAVLPSDRELPIYVTLAGPGDITAPNELTGWGADFADGGVYSDTIPDDAPLLDPDFPLPPPKPQALGSTPETVEPIEPQSAGAHNEEVAAGDTQDDITADQLVELTVIATDTQESAGGSHRAPDSADAGQEQTETQDDKSAAEQAGTEEFAQEEIVREMHQQPDTEEADDGSKTTDGSLAEELKELAGEVADEILDRVLDKIEEALLGSDEAEAAGDQDGDKDAGARQQAEADIAVEEAKAQAQEVKAQEVKAAEDAERAQAELEQQAAEIQAAEEAAQAAAEEEAKAAEAAAAEAQETMAEETAAQQAELATEQAGDESTSDDPAGDPAEHVEDRFLETTDSSENIEDKYRNPDAYSAQRLSQEYMEQVAAGTAASPDQGPSGAPAATAATESAELKSTREAAEVGPYGDLAQASDRQMSAAEHTPPGGSVFDRIRNAMAETLGITADVPRTADPNGELQMPHNPLDLDNPAAGWAPPMPDMVGMGGSPFGTAETAGGDSEEGSTGPGVYSGPPLHENLNETRHMRADSQPAHDRPTPPPQYVPIGRSREDIARDLRDFTRTQVGNAMNLGGRLAAEVPTLLLGIGNAPALILGTKIDKDGVKALPNGGYAIRVQCRGRVKVYRVDTGSRMVAKIIARGMAIADVGADARRLVKGEKVIK